MHKIEKAGLIVIGMVACLFFSIGCEDGKKMVDPKATLEALAEQYWSKRLVDKDYKFTYDLELDKESIPFSDYVKKMTRGEKFKVLSVKTKDVRIDGDRGEVFLSVVSKVPMVPKEVDMTLQDLWLLKSNQWRHTLPPNK